MKELIKVMKKLTEENRELNNPEEILRRIKLAIEKAPKQFDAVSFDDITTRDTYLLDCDWEVVEDVLENAKIANFITDGDDWKISAIGEEDDAAFEKRYMKELAAHKN